MWKLIDVQIIYKKLYQRELVTSDWFFVIRNSSGVQIFRNDEKARQRHLPKMYTLVVTMNWNRFRKMFRIRFCIFYNRSELTHCVFFVRFGYKKSLGSSFFAAYRLIFIETMRGLFSHWITVITRISVKFDSCKLRWNYTPAWIKIISMIWKKVMLYEMRTLQQVYGAQIGLR